MDRVEIKWFIILEWMKNRIFIWCTSLTSIPLDSVAIVWSLIETDLFENFVKKGVLLWVLDGTKTILSHSSDCLEHR